VCYVIHVVTTSTYSSLPVTKQVIKQMNEEINIIKIGQINKQHTFNARQKELIPRWLNEKEKQKRGKREKRKMWQIP